MPPCSFTAADGPRRLHVEAICVLNRATLSSLVDVVSCPLPSVKNLHAAHFRFTRHYPQRDRVRI